MKILHVAPQLSGGGLEVYLHEAVRRLAALGHASAVLHGRAGGALPAGLAARAYHVPGVTDLGCPGLAARLAEVREVLRAGAPDVILVHGATQHWLVRLLAGAAPLVRFVHDTHCLCPGGGKTLRRSTASGGPEPCPHPLGLACLGRAWTRRCTARDPRVALPLLAHLRANLALYRRRAAMACPSVFMRGLLAHNGFDPARVAVLPHFTTLPAQAPPAPGACGPVVLYAGRVHWGKGLGELLRALALLPPEASLDLAGDGPDLAGVKDLARSLGLEGRVRFHGWLDPPALGALYARAAVVAVPSLVPEAFCMAGIEAMAYGRPVVGADSGAIGEWLEHGVTGWLVPPGDTAALAARLREILFSTELAEEMGTAGRERAERDFTPGAHVSGLVQLLERTARGG
ncbi:glycosyltransferase family 4 protein [Desulfocurvus vexinensis]|uniref:glycosyltransferase family 4 protein n=1 Tax=Desulfocurvus vexinensis TaxID=399548 RepID=UPI00048D3ED1|nr:glycosyltransferase family 4 protein [Desulfocurvus vexinensis]